MRSSLTKKERNHKMKRFMKEFYLLKLSNDQKTAIFYHYINFVLFF